MGLIVQKYGGSSVADTEKLRLVAEQVMHTQAMGHQVVVVVSAMGKTTNRLLAQALDITATPSARELDMLVSTGERISMALLAMALQSMGVDAISFTGSQSGIITTEAHQHAKIVEVRPHRILRALAEGKTVIVAGYQGVSRSQEVTTLGRGGSDTTAVALASALHAEACEIYSDVAGVYSADPKTVPSAHVIPEIGYTTMRTMAQLGAKVLNEEAVAHAQKTGVVISARKTGGVHAEQTRVSQNCDPQGVVAVCSSIQHVFFKGTPEACAAFFAVLEPQGAYLLHTSIDRTAWVVNTEHMPSAETTMAVLSENHGVQVHHMGSVSLVGETSACQKMQEKCRLWMSQHGTSVALTWNAEHHVTFHMPKEDIEKNVALLHAFAFGNHGQ